MSYAEFLASKQHTAALTGFRPTFRPDWLFDFQSDLVDWSARKGRAAIFADCGMGKTPMQLVWTQNVVEHTNRPVLIVAPLAASSQTVKEAAKFGIPCQRSTNGKHDDTAQIVITNYERLHLFDPADFAGMVCDESSILKNFDGATRASITEFMRKLEYRLLCTATAAPNDFIELGTSSEALGEMGYTDMLGTFFKNDESSIEPMSYTAKWRFKPHAEVHFWRWMCSWARALRKPSDIGFDDGRFVLPPLTERIEIIETSRPLDGYLFIVPARTLEEQRHERRATLDARCAFVAERAKAEGPFIAWCHLNDEADMLERLIPDARQVSGAMDDAKKQERFDAFANGTLRVLVTKPRISAFGLNWQHCAHMSVFPSHSYEQYYQAIRRCWRFGQTKEVIVDIVSTRGEADVLGNLQRKAAATDVMFSEMVKHMRAAETRQRIASTMEAPDVPAWM